MKTFENMSLAAFVRYGVTGIICVFLFLILPLAIYSPAVLVSVVSVDGILGIIVVGIAVGFIIDGLKLYQFSPTYAHNKIKFMKQVANTLEVSEGEAVTYFIKASQLERDYGKGQIDFVHSRWVMSDICSKLFFIASVVWGGAGIFEFRQGSLTEAYKLIVVGILCLVIALRWFVTSSQEQKQSDALYLNFCKLNKKMIIESAFIVKKEQNDNTAS